jgi:FkbM family methyltransferase
MSRALAIGYDLKRVTQTGKTFRNWPSLLGAMFAQQAGRGPAEITFRTRTGLSLTCPNQPGARLPAYEQFAEDGYRLTWLLGDLIRRPIHVVDVGAHVGAFACNMAQLHPSATVDCFEPSTETADYLERNILANHFRDRISVHRAAMSAETGVAIFDDNGAGSVHNGLVVGGQRLVENEGDQGASGNSLEVPTEGFDDFVANSSTPIDFVKLDCEGGEYELVYGSSPQSWSSVQRMVLEHHPVAGQTWAKLRDWFAAAGLHEIASHDVRDELGTSWLSRDAAPVTR